MNDYSSALQKRIDDWTAKTGKPYLVLGHDVGIASDGFCLLDMTNHQILEMGSRLFDAPQEDKTKRSLAAVRRDRRSSRRNTKRTRDRMKKCLQLLKDHGLVPESETASWLQLKKGDVPTIWLRVKALDERISDRELAQLLYTLCKRRGYIDHGGGNNASDQDEGKVLKALEHNEKEMRDGDWRTVGEMLAHQGRDRNKSGDYSLMVTIGQVEAEARAILSAQRAFGNELVDDSLTDDYVACLTWQASTYARDRRSYDAVGYCVYFPKLKRAARADVSSELCAALGAYHHLVIVEEDGKERHLTKEQIADFITELFKPIAVKTATGITYKAIRKVLDLPARDIFKGVSPDAEKNKGPYQPRAWNVLRGCYRDDILARLFDDRALGDALCEALTYASSRESLEDRLEELLVEMSIDDVPDDIVEELVRKGPYGSKVFRSYGSRSLEALSMLIDAFDDSTITSLADAESATGLDKQRQAQKNRQDRSEALMSFVAYCPECKNPVILRASSQVRKVTNAITRHYGVPNEIHIELARELKASAHEKRVSTKRKNERERRNQANRTFASEILGCMPEEVSGKVVVKMALADEQGWFDAYLPRDGDAAIDRQRLVTDETYCQIDHILPLSRTCDDSRSNKVLVLNKSNQDKGQRTPYEWMTSGKGAPEWEAFQARVLEFCHDPRKRARLLNTCLDAKTEDAFIGRNLSDTRYMSRLFKDWFEQYLLWPDDGQEVHVVGVSGGATASLRHAWGLNRGADNKKDRSDDRHHAVDAAVIAACSRATVSQIARLRSEGARPYAKKRDSRLASSQPWPKFAEDVLAFEDVMVPTRSVRHGFSGGLYDETLYRYAGRNNKGYALLELRSREGASAEGNVRLFDDGSARKVAHCAFVRLWLDPTARKGRGSWYLEPVYYADLPQALKQGYLHKACKSNTPRDLWEPIAQACFERGPINLFPGDVLIVGEHVARFAYIKISGCALKMRNVLADAKNGPLVKDFPTLSTWDASTDVRILNQDCLGHCWWGMRVTLDNTIFMTE